MPPPGYSVAAIPAKFMDKGPSPAGADTNTRAYVIFFSYLGLCAVLTAFIITKLFKSYSVLAKSSTAKPPPKRYVVLFALLAAASLCTTWYYMLKYFELSYNQWMMWRSNYQLPPETMHFGLWLKETKLFKEAWEVAIVGNSRYWWTHQIFFFACGLGLDLERLGIRRGVKHTWAFMLLAQVVAVSFATNLFFLAVLLSPPALPASSLPSAKRAKWIGPWLISLATIFASEIPAYYLASEDYWYNHQHFMTLLLTPHIALLVLPIARVILPSRHLNQDDTEDVHRLLWGVLIFGGAMLWLLVTGLAWNHSGVQGIAKQLYEHPAVSSVGHDVIFCWITWLVWWAAQRQGLSKRLHEKDTDENVWIGTKSRATELVRDANGGLRRR